MTATETARAAAHSTAGQQPAAPASQMTSGMDIASYVSELDRISGVVAHLDRAPAEIKPLRQSLPKVWLVHKSGQSFEVATSWLDSALETMETTSVVRPSLQADIQNRLKIRSEEHTSELQSRGHLVCRLLLEKKNIISATRMPHICSLPVFTRRSLANALDIRSLASPSIFTVTSCRECKSTLLRA